MKNYITHEIINHHVLNQQVINKIVQNKTGMTQTIEEPFYIPYAFIGHVTLAKEHHSLVSRKYLSLTVHIFSITGDLLWICKVREQDQGFIYEAILLLHSTWLEDPEMNVNLNPTKS